MLKIRKSNERGLAEHGWLSSRHTFSFADYFDRNHMAFRSLRVINEDHISPGTGFGMHGHRDMEIITYVVQGSLEHRDSAGHTEILRPGEVQRMSAGTGILHSEMNKSQSDETHLLQIWIMPDQTGADFSYAQKSFEMDLAQRDLTLVVSKNGRDGSISINQDADLFASRLKKDRTVKFNIRPGRHIWLQTIKGPLTVNDNQLFDGDALSGSNESQITISAQEDAEFLLFDLA